MGQRFQTIIDYDYRIEVYHCQWLWGFYAIRRLGTAIRNYTNYGKDGYRLFEEFLKGSFYGKPNDMNKISRYDDDCRGRDNEWIAEGKKFTTFKCFLRMLDNNDGYLYLKIRENNIVGYCFLNKDFDNQSPSAEDYMKTKKWYLSAITEDSKGFDKKQLKEYFDGLTAFSKLSVINPPKRIYKD